MSKITNDGLTRSDTVMIDARQLVIINGHGAERC